MRHRFAGDLKPKAARHKTEDTTTTPGAVVPKHQSQFCTYCTYRHCMLRRLWFCGCVLCLATVSETVLLVLVWRYMRTVHCIAQLHYMQQGPTFATKLNFMLIVMKIFNSVLNFFVSKIEQVCVQPPLSAVNVTLPAFTAERRHLLRRYCWALAPAAQCYPSVSPAPGRSAAKHPHAAAAVDRWDRQTDRRMERRSNVSTFRILCKKR